MQTRTFTDHPETQNGGGRNQLMSWEHGGVKIEVELFRSHKFTGPADEGFRPSKIFVDGDEVWRFQTSGIRPFAELLWLDNEECPMIVGMNSEYVLSVLPTQDFETAQPVLIAGGVVKLLNGSSTTRLLDLKISIASGLGLKPDFTKAEMLIVEARAAAERESRQVERAAAVAEEGRKREERMKAKAAFIQELRKRPIMTAFTATGDTRKGTPVTEDEFPRLPGDRHYIFVDSPGNPISYFFLTQDKQRRGETDVSAEKPEVKIVSAVPNQVQAERIITVLFDGNEIEVALYSNGKAVEEARKDFRRAIIVAFYETTKGVRTGRICLVRASKDSSVNVGVANINEELLVA